MRCQTCLTRRAPLQQPLRHPHPHLGLQRARGGELWAASFRTWAAATRKAGPSSRLLGSRNAGEERQAKQHRQRGQQREEKRRRGRRGRQGGRRRERGPGRRRVRDRCLRSEAALRVTTGHNSAERWCRRSTNSSNRTPQVLFSTNTAAQVQHAAAVKNDCFIEGHPRGLATPVRI